MKEGRECIFCTSPFQLITAIHMQLLRKKSTDLVLVNQMKNVEDIAEGVRRADIFDNVYIIYEDEFWGKKRRSKVVARAGLFTVYARMEKIVESYPIAGSTYRRVFISSRALTSRLYAIYLAKHRIRTEFIYYDDGLGTYYDPNILNPSRGDLMARRLFCGKIPEITRVRKILVYEPDLFEHAGVNNREDIKVLAIPKWKYNPKLKAVVNDVFGYTSECSFRENVMVFDGIFRDEERERVDDFYLKLRSILGKENMVIKRHPRDKSPTSPDLKYYAYDQLPFEVICLNADIENKLLITTLSTAVVTPIMLLGLEPYVLALNKVEGLIKELFAMNYHDFQRLYQSKGRFSTPRTMEEALAFVEEYKSIFLD